jgi:hypothetical protein
MRTYTNPKWVHVEPRSFPVAAVVVLGVMAWSGYELVAWLASVMAAIVTVLAIVTAGSAATLAVVLYRRRGLQHLDAPQWVVERCGTPRIPSYDEIPAHPVAAAQASPTRAIAPVVHYHLHLYPATTAQPAIEESK